MINVGVCECVPVFICDSRKNGICTSQVTYSEEIFLRTIIHCPLVMGDTVYPMINAL